MAEEAAGIVPSARRAPACLITPMLRALRQVRAAVSHLNPNEVRKLADQSLRIGLVASDDAAFTQMENFLIPAQVSSEKRAELMLWITRADHRDIDRFDLVLCEEGFPCPPEAFTFYPYDADRTIRTVLEHRGDLEVPLARRFPPFRNIVVQNMVHRISKENAMFAVVTALPNFIPNIFELPWAAGEFASDTAFLTINQVRMAFLIAAASDQDIGYSQQSGEIASIVAGAFGWRTLARELVGKIPLGGGLIPKAAIAYAGTFVIGQGLNQLTRIGYGLSRDERKDAYEQALERGRSVAESLVGSIRRRRTA
jgi:hypothetical protein